MGLYDNIDYECNCPICGEIVNNFQSKYGECLLDTLKPDKVRNFYTFCKNCDSWIEINTETKEERMQRVHDQITD